MSCILSTGFMHDILKKPFLFGYTFLHLQVDQLATMIQSVLQNPIPQNYQQFVNNANQVMAAFRSGVDYTQFTYALNAYPSSLPHYPAPVRGDYCVALGECA